MYLNSRLLTNSFAFHSNSKAFLQAFTTYLSYLQAFVTNYTQDKPRIMAQKNSLNFHLSIKQYIQSL